MRALKRPEVWIYPLLAVGLWAFFAFAMPDVLEFWEKNQLFRFTSEYWHFFDHEPFGTLIYLHTFLIQFSYYPWLGAIVYSLLFVLTAWLFNRCFTVNGIQRLLPGLVTVALLLPTTVNFGLLVLMVVFLTVLGAHLWIYWKNRVVRYICQVIVLAALLYLLREYIVWVLPFYLCLDFYRTRQNGIRFNSLWLLPAVCGTVLAWFAEIWFCAPYNFIFVDNLFQFAGGCFSPIKNMIYSCFSPDKKIFVGLGLTAIISLFFTFCRLPNQKFVWIISLICLSFEIWITKNSAQSIIDYQKTDNLCRTYNWEDALHNVDKQWEKVKKKDDTESMGLLCGQTRTALLATRKATSILFTYPYPFFPILFPVSIMNKSESLTLPPFYTYIGCFSESLHLDYDCLTGHNISANILNHIIITSLIVDDTVPILKFINFLQNSLFYRNQASIYLDHESRLKLQQVIRGKKMLPQKNYSVWGYRPDEDVLRQYKQQPNNPYFYEYYLAVALLQKRHTLIRDELPKIKIFYPHHGRYIAPRHIQEAILANFNYIPLRFAYPSSIEGVDNNTWQDYWLFINDNEAFHSGEKTFSDLGNTWVHTYWFYDHYGNTIIDNNDNQK